MKTILKLTIIFVLTLIFTSCSSKTYTIEIHEKDHNSKERKKVALFLDGTANDRNSRTNISKVFEIVANQNKDNMYLFYNEGVGTSGRFLGAMTGWGTDKDVKEAYSFLSDYYKSGDKLYIFGFSRGAYTARILAGMLYTVGIYDLSNFNDKDKEEIISELYHDAYKGNSVKVQKSKEKILSDKDKIINKWNKKREIKTIIAPFSENIIDILGIWDTVEALGIIPTKEALNDKLSIKKDNQEFTTPNKKYVDQICNIKKTFHAISLDDNRAYVFTPIIMTNKEKIDYCPYKSIENTVEEVWFSGAHADVGGGYDKNNTLSGVSLNWMLNKINKFEENDKLLPSEYKVFENIYGTIHNAEEGISAAYKEGIRINILKKYLEKSQYEKIKIHKSVKNRLENQPIPNGFDSKWYEDNFFKNCVDVQKNDKGTKITFNDCKNITIIGD
jgi:uncharacterized protein (DUF2235 family)